MYDIGFGLGKMMEGATGGAVKGQMINMARDERQQDRTSTEQYRNKTLGQGQQRIDNDEHRIKIQQHATAFKTAYDIAQGSPDPEGTFTSVFKSLDPEGEIPKVTFGETDMEISYEGLNISGSKEHVVQAIGIISKNPEVTPQVLGKLAELGLVKITVPKKGASKGFGTFSQGQGIFSKDTGKVTLQPDASFTSGKGTGKAGGKGGLKVSDVNTALNALFKKYKVDAGLGINVTPDGKYTVDMTTFMAGKETAYNIIKKKADAGDPEAKKDLEKINEYYQLMDTMIRGSQDTGPSLNKMVPKAGVDKAKPGTDKTKKTKATFDPATGRFNYK
jgi:hypothetical protein